MKPSQCFHYLKPSRTVLREVASTIFHRSVPAGSSAPGDGSLLSRRSGTRHSDIEIDTPRDLHCPSVHRQGCWPARKAPPSRFTLIASALRST
jgi:hypothetical protein